MRSPQKLIAFYFVTIALALLFALGTGEAIAADHIKIGVVRSFSGGPNFVAAEKGFFAAEGLDAEFVFFESAQPISVAVAGGDADFGTTGLTASFFNLAAQGALKIIASSTWERRGFQQVGVLVSNQAAAAGLKSLKDIGGHSAGITQSGTPLHYVIGLAAEKYGIDLKTVKVLLLQSNPNVASALAGGQTDIAVQSVANVFSNIEKGNAKLLAWASDELPNEQGEGAFTSTKHANEDGDLVRRYLRGYRKGIAYFHDAFADASGNRRDGPHAEEVAAIAAKYTQQPIEVIKKGVPFVDPEARIVEAHFIKIANWYQSQGMIKEKLDVPALIDRRYAVLVAGE